MQAWTKDLERRVLFAAGQNEKAAQHQRRVKTDKELWSKVFEDAWQRLKDEDPEAPDRVTDALAANEADDAVADRAASDADRLSDIAAGK